VQFLQHPAPEPTHCSLPAVVPPVGLVLLQVQSQVLSQVLSLVLLLMPSWVLSKAWSRMVHHLWRPQIRRAPKVQGTQAHYPTSPQGAWEAQPQGRVPGSAMVRVTESEQLGAWEAQMLVQKLVLTLMQRHRHHHAPLCWSLVWGRQTLGQQEAWAVHAAVMPATAGTALPQ
jgi:hypothetical protein